MLFRKYVSKLTITDFQINHKRKKAALKIKNHCKVNDITQLIQERSGSTKGQKLRIIMDIVSFFGTLSNPSDEFKKYILFIKVNICLFISIIYTLFKHFDPKNTDFDSKMTEINRFSIERTIFWQTKITFKRKIINF